MTSTQGDAYAGLCGHCTNARIIVNRHGSRFYRCALSDVDSSYPRYPALPVLACAGHVEGAPGAANGNYEAH